MTWNYRVCKKVYKSYVVDDDDYSKVIGSVEGEQFGICEVYYNDKGEIIFTKERFIEPYSETLEELKSSFEKMKEAFDLPVLDLDNLSYLDYT